MDGPGKYYSKWNKEEERQILYDFIHIWIRKTSNKQKKKSYRNTEENKLVVTKEAGGWRVSKMGKGSIVYFFKLKKKISQCSWTEFILVFSDGAASFTCYFTVILTLDSTLSHDLPQGKVVFIRTFAIFNSWHLVAVTYTWGYTSWFKKCLSN